ncbi:hypothetical protein [Domibacillus indicus]|uniref:hypothetical protein n=1 Tax=Domibacillus indicus TaxID=1437523 RepID=UPI0006180EAB|nr:hypothetical protein [Domibacillus indicus]
MAVYRDLLEKIQYDPDGYRFSRLKKPPGKRPGMPQDYLDFLEEVGYGSVGDGCFMFYGGLLEAEELFDTEENPELDGVLLLGDNFSGDAVGFLAEGEWPLVEVWHEDLTIFPREEKTFAEFARNVFAKKL